MSGGPAASPAASPAGPGDAGPAAVPILMYHQIAAGQRSRLAVTPAAFAAQLADLDAGGFTPVSAAALAAALAGGGPPLPARPVVLTFDDGYADFHAAALPLLASYGFTATLFVTTGWLRPAAGRAVSQPCPAPALSWSQLAEAAAAGLEIAGHSHSHPQLDRVPAGAPGRAGRLQGAAGGQAGPAGQRPRLSVRVLQPAGSPRRSGLRPSLCVRRAQRAQPA